MHVIRCLITPLAFKLISTSRGKLKAIWMMINPFNPTLKEAGTRLADDRPPLCMDSHDQTSFPIIHYTVNPSCQVNPKILMGKGRSQSQRSATPWLTLTT